MSGHCAEIPDAAFCAAEPTPVSVLICMGWPVVLSKRPLDFPRSSDRFGSITALDEMTAKQTQT
jgi:hypothetical protein